MFWLWYSDILYEAEHAKQPPDFLNDFFWQNERPRQLLQPAAWLSEVLKT